MKNFSLLEKKLKIKFINIQLLEQALVHRSYLNENTECKLDHNERLEFLGDAVLELVVTEYLFKHYDNPEGDLTAWRAALVNGKMLAKIADSLKIGDFLMLSRGEKKDKGRARQYILANTFESIIGAIYLDQGYDSSKKFIEKNVLQRLKEVLEKQLYIDAKSKFQEKAQEKTSTTPDYKVLHETGPDHDKHFTIGVYLGKKLIAKGSGASKQSAQQSAAQNGLDKKKWN
ncbi:ribonuclease III [bacterium]|nr:ribonuclease III [bacterium]|tara:strand:+ start:185 stop:874 length:690 start_codon:yes stop_codon:yes gene_type:complete